MVYCVVLVENTSIKLVVDVSWVESEYSAHDLNSGLRPCTKRKIFYSPFAVPPNFALPIRRDFDENAESCYMSYLLHSFGEHNFVKYIYP